MPFLVFNLILLWETSADDKLVILVLFFSFDTSCKSSRLLRRQLNCFKHNYSRQFEIYTHFVISEKIRIDFSCESSKGNTCESHADDSLEIPKLVFPEKL